MSCTFLDYIWGGLAAASLTSMFMLSVFWLVTKFASSRAGARHLKWFYHANYSLIALTMTAAFTLIIFFNADLATGCFAKFAESNDGFALTRLLAGTWLAGVLVMLSWDLARALGSRRQMRGLRAIASPNLEAWTQKMGLRRKVELLVTKAPGSPYIAGLLNHRIVVPESFLESEALGPVLAHELAHAHDYDSLWMLSERFCRRVLFFNPLVYILSSSYQLVVERSADELAVLKGEVAPRRLAQALVSVAEEMSFEPSALKLGVGRCYRDLRIRIESLGRRKKSNRIFTFVFGAALLFSAGAAWPRIERHSYKSAAMCEQVEHEKAIESLFQIQSEPKTCEEINQ